MLVIGWGNPLRGDDGAGFVAAERLGGMAVQQLTPELAADIAQADKVVFIDADASLEPGTWIIEELGPGRRGSSSTHSGSPAELLAVTEILYGHAAPALMIRIGASNFAHGES